MCVRGQGVGGEEKVPTMKAAAARDYGGGRGGADKRRLERQRHGGLTGRNQLVTATLRCMHSEQRRTQSLTVTMATRVHFASSCHPPRTINKF